MEIKKEHGKKSLPFHLTWQPRLQKIAVRVLTLHKTVLSKAIYKKKNEQCCGVSLAMAVWTLSWTWSWKLLWQTDIIAREQLYCYVQASLNITALEKQAFANFPYFANPTEYVGNIFWEFPCKVPPSCAYRVKAGVAAELHGHKQNTKHILLFIFIV